MKNLLLLFITFSVTLFTNKTANAQCTRDASLQAASDTSMTGTATLEYSLVGTKVLKLSSNFSTSTAPDLDIYLTNNTTVGNSSEKINLHALDNLNGAQEYTVPDNVTIDQYSHIVIHCSQYNHHWGHGVFGTAQGVECSTLSIKDSKKELFKIYPNPVQNKLKIEGIKEAALIKIHSIEGKLVQVFQKKNFLNGNTIPVSQLNAGIYIVTIITENTNTVLKFQKL